MKHCPPHACHRRRSEFRCPGCPMCQPADGATTMRLKQATSKLALAAWMLVSALLVIGAAAGGRAYAQSGLDLRFLAPFRSFEIGDYPGSVAVGDINGDGRPDVIVGRVLSNSVSVFLATEDGSFTKGQDLDAGSTRYGPRRGKQWIEFRIDPHRQGRRHISAKGRLRCRNGPRVGGGRRFQW